MARLSARMRRFLEVLVLSLTGSVPLAAFFISALFPGYTPLQLSDAGITLLFLPLVLGILFGAILSEHDLRSVAFGTVAITGFSSVMIAAFIVSPILAGVAAAGSASNPTEVLEIFVAQRVMLFIIISLPILLLGAVIGSVISDRLIPSSELRRELDRLRADTKEWHALLDKIGRMRLVQEIVEKEEPESEDDKAK